MNHLGNGYLTLLKITATPPKPHAIRHLEGAKNRLMTKKYFAYMSLAHLNMKLFNNQKELKLILFT